MIDLLGQCAPVTKLHERSLNPGLPPPTKPCASFCRIPAKPFLTTVERATSRAAGRARPVVLRDNTPVSERDATPEASVLAWRLAFGARFCRGACRGAPHAGGKLPASAPRAWRVTANGAPCHQRCLSGFRKHSPRRGRHRLARQRKPPGPQPSSGLSGDPRRRARRRNGGCHP